MTISGKELEFVENYQTGMAQQIPKLCNRGQDQHMESERTNATLC